MRLNQGRTRNPRAFVLMTALFMVLLIFATVTATVANVRFSQSLTVQSAEGSQARFLSRAGLSYALAELEADPSWSPTKISPEVKSYGDEEFRLWVTPDPTEPTLFTITSEAETQGRQWTSHLIVRKEQPQLESVLFSRYQRDNAVDGLYLKRASDTGWTSVEPPKKAKYKNNGTLEYESSYPGDLQDLQGNNKGQLYARWERDPGKIDTLYRYDIASDTWTVLPPVPNVVYNSAGVNVAGPGTYATKLSSLASDGGDILFCRQKTANNDGLSDTVFRFNDANDTWTALPPVPNMYNDGTTTTTASGFAENINHLSADESGALYGLVDRGLTNPTNPDSIMKWDGASWSAIEPPDKVTLDINGNATLPGGKADHLSEMCVTPGGDIIVRGINGGGAPDTIYKYVDGHWTYIAPPQSSVLLDMTSATQLSSSPADYDELSVDRDGRIYMREKRGAGQTDTIYTYHDGEYSYLPAQHASYYSGGTEINEGFQAKSTQDIGSGAVEVTGGPRFVPTMEF